MELDGSQQHARTRLPHTRHGSVRRAYKIDRSCSVCTAKLACVCVTHVMVSDMSIAELVWRDMM